MASCTIWLSTTCSVSGAVAKITLTASTLTHYFLVRSGENNIYMGTYVTAEPSAGELRWITRLNAAVLTGVPAESRLIGNAGAIESSDIFGMSDGTTRSKYYGNQRAMDYTVRGVTGSGVGVFMAYGNRESSSGGPFFRDIQNQSGGDTKWALDNRDALEHYARQIEEEGTAAEQLQRFLAEHPEMMTGDNAAI